MPTPASATASRAASWAVPSGRSGGFTMTMREPSRRGLEAHEDEAAHDLVGPLVDLEQHALALAGELVHRAAGDDLALAQDDGRVADPLDLLEQVRRHHDVDAELGADAADQGEHVVALHRVEAVGGLVEQHQVGVVGDGLGQLHPLALAGGHGADGAEALLAETDRPERIARPVGGVALRQPVDLGDVAHEVVGPGVRRQAVVLGGVADARPHGRTGPGGVEAEDLERTAVGLVQTEHEPEQGGLSRAVGAEEAGDARRDAEGGAVERGGGPEATGERGGVDHRGRRCRVLTHGLASVTVPARRPQGRSARSANPRSGCSAVATVSAVWHAWPQFTSRKQPRIATLLRSPGPGQNRRDRCAEVIGVPDHER